VAGERLIVRGQVEGRPPGEDQLAPSAFVLRESETGRELRYPLLPDGAGLRVACTIDAGDFGAAGRASVWEVRAAWAPSTGIDDCDVIAVLIEGRVRPVMIDRGERLSRVTPRASQGGRLIFVAEEVGPHAEFTRVFVEDEAILVEAVLSRLPVPSSGTAAVLVASSREREREVTAPASLDGDRVRSRIPMDAFGTDIAGTEYWDLYVRLEGGDSLRVAGFLDGVPDKKSAMVFPDRELNLPGGRRSLRPYFTVNNGLSVRSKPVPAGAPAPADGTPPTERAEAPRWKSLQRWALHVARWVALRLARVVIRRLPPRRSIPAVRDGRPHVSILVMHAYGMGGTIRTVFNQAAYLSRNYDVEIVSQVRERKEPFFALPPGVTLSALDDRTDAGRPRWPADLLRNRLAALPSLLVHEADSTFARCSLWTDVQVVRRLRALRGGILMTTRPSLNLLAAQLAVADVVTVGQVHLQYQNHNAVLRDVLPGHYRHLDALTTLTESDRDHWSRALDGSNVPVVRIPNSVTPLSGGLADPDSRVVVTAGRLTGPKGFDLAVRAFEQVVREHPDWTLRIYGSGPQSRRLRQMIFDRDLYNNVLLMGRTERMGEDLAQASIFVLSSRSEGFPMVMLEAMSKGLAVVSTDCGGPGEIIEHGTDGLLVPNGDVDALARALLALIEDQEERRRLSAAALRTAGRYEPQAIGREWDDVLARLLAERSPSWWRPEA
jgi:glycosyltransferase involved in cell wall biosynthesis